MKAASAPVSWGITEIEGLQADLGYSEIMDEIRAAGYEGTELGPWGFYPTAPDELRGELAAAASLTAEGDAIAEATGSLFAPYGAVMLAGFRGSEVEATRLIASVVPRTKTISRSSAAFTNRCTLRRASSYASVASSLR